MPRRILSDAYIDRRVAKIDAIHENNQSIVLYPQVLMDEFPHGRLSQRDKREIADYYKQLRDVAFVQGFWQGWTLREGCKDV